MMSLLLSLVLPAAFATTLTVKNDTGAEMRIAKLANRCGEVLVAEETPLKIARGGQASFGIRPTIHTYTICGSGLCSSSALGFRKDHEGVYVFRVFLRDGVINGEQQPDHWIGDKECPK